MKFLADREMVYVSVDSPQFPDRSTMPPITGATARWAYVRMHGRNRDTFFARVGSAADRFDWLYDIDELKEWETPIRDLASATERAWVMFNNCKYDYAPRNAREMAEILGDVVAEREGGVPTGEVADASDGADSGAKPDGDQLSLGV